MIRPVDLTRERVEGLSRDVPARPDRWKPSMWTFRDGDRKLLVKDVQHTSGWFRYTIGRWALRREAKFYRRLSDLDFIPKLIGRLDRDSLVFEWVRDAPSLGLKEVRYDLPESFCDDLAACVDSIHRRGVVHLDLRHRTNVLVAPDGKPRLVDFEIALFLGPLVPLLGWIDRSAVAKYRVRYMPHQASPEQVSRYNRFRRLRSLWRLGRIWPPPWRR